MKVIKKWTVEELVRGGFDYATFQRRAIERDGKLVVQWLDYSTRSWNDEDIPQIDKWCLSQVDQPDTRTVTLRVPKPGDSLPFLVCGEMKVDGDRWLSDTGAIIYTEDGEIAFLHGSCETGLYSLSGLGEVLGLPTRVPVDTRCVVGEEEATA